MTTLRPTNNHNLCIGIDQSLPIEGAQPRLMSCQKYPTQNWIVPNSGK